MNTVVVIGGGASGMIAALTAAENPENRVLVLERQQRLGRKLLATGNGRCNLTNTQAGPAHYHGHDPDFAVPALSRFGPADTLRFFEDLGLLTATEEGGRVYPLSNTANSVLDVLRFALDRAAVEQRTACSVRMLERRGNSGYTVLSDEGAILADKLIVACGGAAGAKLGGVSDGYELLKPLGHKRTALYPALVQIRTSPEYPRALKGIRVQTALHLMDGSTLIAESRGELQFTENGISGPAAFDISRAAASESKELCVHCDFLSLPPETVEALLQKRRSLFASLPASEFLTGMLHNRLGRMLVRYSGLDGNAPVSSLRDRDLARLAQACTDFQLKVTGTEGFENAQVTAGGIKTSGFNPQTLESWFCPGLFVCGELLDVDGDCGGYNLQWAWASGRLAGRLGA